ncbi:UbiD family decarboxylase domain-containing protein, partial [Acinetobacter baumannii]
SLANPLEPKRVGQAPVQEVVHRDGIDVGGLVPAVFHAPGDAGRYITAGIVVVRDPVTGIYNASYHRLQLLGGNRLA